MQRARRRERLLLQNGCARGTSKNEGVVIKAIDILHAQVGTVTSRVDKSVAFRVITPELTLDQRATILGLHGTNVRVMLEPLDVSIEGIDVVEAETGIKTPSERLRSVLFVWYKQTAPEVIGTSFDEFYRLKMEKLIEWVKGKLEPMENAA